MEKEPKPKKFNLRSFVIATLRRASYRSAPRSEALKLARVARGRYKCAHCPEGIIHPKSNINLDHIVPVVPVTGWDSYEGFIERLFCNVEGLQVLCEEHHSIKSKGENLQRKEIRDANKPPKPEKKKRVK